MQSHEQNTDEGFQLNVRKNFITGLFQKHLNLSWDMIMFRYQDADIEIVQLKKKSWNSSARPGTRCNEPSQAWPWWNTSIVPALGRLQQGDHQFEAREGDIAKLRQTDRFLGLCISSVSMPSRTIRTPHLYHLIGIMTPTLHWTYWPLFIKTISQVTLENLCKDSWEDADSDREEY